MTLTTVQSLQLPSATGFLNSVCPGISYLDYNIHYSLEEDLNKLPQHGLVELDWPLTGSHSTTTNKAVLSPTYLHISRPPLNSVPGSNESTTYVSMPYHITNFFEKIVKTKEAAKSKDGGMHIGANVNPLVHDPFKLIHLNPGCLSAIIDLANMKNANTNNNNFSSKNPFDKLTSNFNKLLRITNSNANANDNNGNTHNLLAFLSDNRSNSNGHIIEKIMEFNNESYLNELNSTTTSKLLISSHINVLNIIGIDDNSNYKNTHEILADKPSLPYNEESLQDGTQYPKIIENPLLRIQFRQNLIITSMVAFTSLADHPIVILGFGSGEIFMINLSLLTFQVFDVLSSNPPMTDSASINSYSYSNSPIQASVTSLSIISNNVYEFLIVAGYSNGEIAIIDPYSKSNDDKSKLRYSKRIVGKDDHITYFKKFDLSPFTTTKEELEEYPNYLIGHMKISHKAITSITSTLPYNTNENHNQSNPMIVAFASDDGLVRFIDLVSTYKMNYGDKSNPLNNPLICDMVSNYFHNQITDIQYSPDFKFFCVVGKGDLIEIFKMTYYNINGFLTKCSNNHHSNNANPTATSTYGGLSGRRSRSGTINSANSGSGTNIPVNNQFLSPTSTMPSNTFEHMKFDESFHNPSNSNINMELIYPLMIKDIKIVSRFKGHTNTVHKIKFVRNEEDIENSESSVSSSPVYKLISCGHDGQIIIWEFDYKALPKVKRHQHHSVNKQRRKHSMQTSPPPFQPQFKSKTVVPTHQNNISSNRISASMSMKTSQNYHARNISLTQPDDTMSPSMSMASFQFNNLNGPWNNSGSGTMTNMASVLNGRNNSREVSQENLTDNIQVIVALYKSLYDLRLKRHYTKLVSQEQSTSKAKKKYSTIIHPIISDKLVPSIEVPLLVIDLSHWIKDGKLEGFYLDKLSFWCFGKNGDIFRYEIK